jgi:inorganic pyrophosphatase
MGAEHVAMEEACIAGGIVTGPEASAPLLIIATGAIGVAFALILLKQVAAVKLEVPESGTAPGSGGIREANLKLKELYDAITVGASSFLNAEYKMCAIFVAFVAPCMAALIAWGSKEGDGAPWDWSTGTLSGVSFVVGALTSMVSGWIGMTVAVFSNARCTVGACGTDAAGWTASFNTAFKAGGVMGFSLTGIAILSLYCLIIALRPFFTPDQDGLMKLMEVIAGFGLGGSSIAMFGRVGGGIYTKAADVGADLAGKVVEDLPEDDPHNPGTIADNVGDNVGDVAGMGSDLFGSFGEASCAALLVGASSASIVAAGWGALLFPLTVSGAGIVVCLITNFVATDIAPVKAEKDIENVLKTQLLVSSLLMTPVVYFLTTYFLPAATCGSCVGGFIVGGTCSSPFKAFLCVAFGLWGGCLIGFITEYYTSFSYEPVKEIANACRTGAATNIIYGLAAGYKSAIAPVFILAFIVFGSHTIGGFYGIALSALGMLSTLSTCLAIDVYGPVCDNAGGIAEMCELHPDVRDKTDALDAAGNTTAAIGKGFAIGSACLVGLALFGAFVTRLNDAGAAQAVDLLDPITFAGLLVGAMLPYWFSAMTMKSVGMAANAMVQEIKRQFDLNPNLLIPNHPDRPDYDTCISISTDASLREMVLPGALVMLSPILCGVGFGTRCVTGLLAGGIASGVQMAISSSNTGGAWDNAKKYISAHNMDDVIALDEPEVVKDGKVNTKKSQIFKAAVTGDTVGDPLKDTSGPALNILMKLMAIISFVFAPLFMAVNNGGGLIVHFIAPAAPSVALNPFAIELAVASGASGAANQASSIFIATIFLAGAAAGMGGLFLTQRLAAPPRIQRASLAKPLLVCRPESADGDVGQVPAAAVALVGGNLRSAYSPLV